MLAFAWLNELKLICSDMSCLLYLIMRYLNDWFSLSSNKKWFSNLFKILLKRDLFVAHSSDQNRNKPEIFETARIRSISIEVSDLKWLKVISANLSFVENLVSEANWCSMFIKLIKWNVKRIISVLTISLSMSEKNWTFYQWKTWSLQEKKRVISFDIQICDDNSIFKKKLNVLKRNMYLNSFSIDIKTKKKIESSEEEKACLCMQCTNYQISLTMIDSEMKKKEKKRKDERKMRLCRCRTGYVASY